MDIDLRKLNFTFTNKPLLIGGMAMEYYNLRPSGSDIDVDEFEIWQSICLFGYDSLSRDAIEMEDYTIISLEKLLFLKALAMRVEKYHRDLELSFRRS